MPTRGYQSCVSARLHFGMGSAEFADSVKIVWPLGKTSVLKKVKANQLIAIDEVSAKLKEAPPVAPSKIFSAVESLIGYEHTEYGSNDFQRQPLLKDNALSRWPGNGSGRC